MAGFEEEENTNTNCASVGKWLSDRRYTQSLGHGRSTVANLIQLCSNFVFPSAENSDDGGVQGGGRGAAAE